ncbi:MAG: flagellar biosynthesis protein FlhF [Clostridiales bacterium]|jgi:flagellar biosynthesis protein FlhF|nr:flagellar biosynthesis protein FlhF [Clostridiales bacterium]
MKIKKYEGKTERDVMQHVKDELGPSAIILSIKRKPYKGLMAWFRAPLFVITAAYEEKTSLQKMWDESASGNASSYLFARENARLENQREALGKLPPKKQEPEQPSAGSDTVMKEVQLADQQQRIMSLENKLHMTEELLEKVVAQLNVAEQMARSPRSRKYENSLIQIFYESLLEQGVTPEIAEKLLEDVDAIDEQEKIDITLIVKIVYNTIMGILGEPNAIKTDNATEETQPVVFMGPTGVGKTTTIAKLSSILFLNHNLRVGLITADTYRIAAVEQLKTYAEILGLEVQVVYGNDEIESSLAQMSPGNDVVLIDTAGRSHKNEGNISELKGLLDRIPDSKRYLVLSVTTKYDDLINIVNTYTAATDFDLIFTKLDETTTLGSILNICYLTERKVSYITFGQNVPDDIEIVKPDKLAKALLGLGASGDLPLKRKGGAL